VNGAVALPFAVYAWPRRGTPGARPFAILNVLGALASWAYAAHFSVGNPDGTDLFVRLRFAAQSGLPPAVLAP
jgi:hypothetical protein